MTKVSRNVRNSWRPCLDRRFRIAVRMRLSARKHAFRPTRVLIWDGDSACSVLASPPAMSIFETPAASVTLICHRSMAHGSLKSGMQARWPSQTYSHNAQKVCAATCVQGQGRSQRWQQLHDRLGAAPSEANIHPNGTPWSYEQMPGHLSPLISTLSLPLKSNMYLCKHTEI